MFVYLLVSGKLMTTSIDKTYRKEKLLDWERKSLTDKFSIFSFSKKSTWLTFLKNRLEIDTSLAGSQKDIFPTLYNLTLKDTKYLSIGNNLFDKFLF